MLNNLCIVYFLWLLLLLNATISNKMKVNTDSLSKLRHISINGHIEMEKLRVHSEYTEIGIFENKEHIHEVIVGIKLNNLDILEQLVLQKSIPSHPDYQNCI